MFDCGPKTQYITGQRDKFVRLDDLDSRASSPSTSVAANKCGLSIDGLGRGNHRTPAPSKSFKRGMKKGSQGLKSIGRSLGFGVSRAVFPEDLKVSEKRIFDPQDKLLTLWNKLFVMSCILGVSIDPLFFFLPVFNKSEKCLDIDRKLAITATTLRTIVDAFYLIHMVLQFRTAYIAPSSRVFGRGELVIDPGQIAKRYLKCYFIIDFLAVLPLPQIVVWRFLQRSNGSDVLATKQALFFIILLQYIPRFARIMPLTSELKRTSGVFAETAWAGAVSYLLLYMLASHIVGAFWYLLSVERNDTCWQKACKRKENNCTTDFLYCGNQDMANYNIWRNISEGVLSSACPVGDETNPPFDFGIFRQALASEIVSSRKFLSKYCYCLWWGLQNLSTLGQGLQTSTYPGESIFSIALAIFGLILFALLIGNMQTYLQSLTIRLEEMRVKRRDSEQWMHHRLLPPDLRERVRRYDQYKWLETRGVDEHSLVESLPKDLRRDIKRHLCLALVKRVPLFENMDEETETMEKATERQRVLLQHLRPSFTSSSLEDIDSSLSASICSAGDSAAYHRSSVFGDDVVIVAAYRTPQCKSKRGGFKDTYPDDLLAPVLKALIEKTNINPAEVGDIVVGSVLAPGSQRASECRMAAFYAGFPETVPVRTVNRQCSSGLQAVADVAAAIKAGFYDIGIGAGLESMTTNPMAWEGSVNPRVKTMADAQNCLLPMGITSENVAHRFGVTRQEQDKAAAESHRKAAAATASGKFKDEIIPVKTKIVDPKSGDETPVTISVDDGIRASTTVGDLGKLKPVFKKDGTTTAGNSSQVSDGAGAVLLMKRSIAMQKGLPILGVFRTFAAVGVDPAIMGIGPAVAIPAAVKSAGLELGDIDLFEINEAFASQFLYCQKKLELDPEKINVNGGAMAIGHPLGATGARCVATLLHEMKRRGKDCRFGVVSMCIGTGMGAAAVFERGDSCDELCNTRTVKNHNFLSKDTL